MITYYSILTIIGIGLIITGVFLMRHVIKIGNKDDGNILAPVFEGIASIFLCIIGVIFTCCYFTELLAILCKIK
jgi:uncharacterized membrane protein HdeD (DUF308 family)